MCEFMKDVSAGALTGVIGTVVGHPLDVIKLRLQGEPGVYRSILGCGYAIFREANVRGLFRGLIPPMVNLTLLNSLAFGLYGNFKKLMSDRMSNYVASSKLQYFVMGCGVGFVTSLVSTPSEFLKVKMQHSSGKIYNGSLDALIKISKQHGMSALYTGYTINTIREMMFSTTYFGVYELSKASLMSQLGNIFNAQCAILLSGGISGMLGWAVSYPLDVIKNLKQSQSLEKSQVSNKVSALALSRERLSKFGVAGFYYGIQISLVRAFIVSSVRFSVYESAVHMWNAFEQNLLNSVKI
ncbi:mitochondrial basic amino acids transporter-like [Schistocerca gregaria]|uniref:mitochondrial basic amino acids transporter-like n=1 Tax=Schistocerca gregaria TaxID=7010 RepID=UPI00211E5DEB|nr:mitochondrial basic amino acids transporter-like [Schistocerca gregaria]